MIATAEPSVGLRSHKALVVGIVGLLLASGLAVRSLESADWDPTFFVAFGEEATPTRQYAEERLGDVFLRSELGHDGRFFFVQTNDPLILNPATNASVLDRPLYRSQRMLYPLLAGGFGLFTPEVIVWTMLGVNVLALGVGSWVVALLASRMGGSAWWGLAFPLNLGFISEMNISGGGIVAGVALFAAVLSIVSDRWRWGILFLSLAVLAREATLLAAFGASWWLWSRDDRRKAILSSLVPAVTALLWAGYVRLRISLETGADQVQEIGLPFVGFFRALGSWVSDPVDMVIGVVMMLLLLVFVRRVLIDRRPLGWMTVGFAFLAILFTEQVWRSYFDITRGIAPVITAYVLLIVLDDGDKVSVFERLS